MITALETILYNFFQNPFVRGIFVLIGLDIATGIGAAIKVGYFDWQKVAAFYRTNVMPYVPGYFVLWLFTAFGLADVIPNELVVALNGTGAAFIYASLLGSVWDNVQRTRAPLVPNEYAPLPSFDGTLERESVPRVSAPGIEYGTHETPNGPANRVSGDDPDPQANTRG
jgi:hypothetical protein